MPNRAMHRGAPPARDPRAVALLDRVEELRRRGHHDAARDAALEALAEYPYDAEGHHLLARIYAARGEAQQARDEWETALRLDPNHREARVALTSRPVSPPPSVAMEDEDTLPRGMPAIRSPGARSPRIARSPQTSPAVFHRPSVDQPGMPSFEDSRVIAALLTDADGMVVTQHALDGVSDAACQALGALMSGLARETTQVLVGLGLGTWRTLSVECASGGLGLCPAPDDHVVILAVRAGMPLGLARRYLATAQRHARAALESE